VPTTVEVTEAAAERVQSAAPIVSLELPAEPAQIAPDPQTSSTIEATASAPMHDIEPTAAALMHDIEPTTAASTHDIEPTTATAAQPADEPQRYADPQSILAGLRLDWPGELMQIETDPQKVRPVEEEQDTAPRPPRVRRRLPPISDEPLVQVETRKHDAGAVSHPL
jgi:ribonuclease E